MMSLARMTAGFAALLLGLAMTGCASKPATLYQWEGYQQQVYEYLTGDGTTPAEQLTALQAHAEKARTSQAALPPGFRAHVGLINLQLGQNDEARRSFEAEKAAFPESSQYMDFLLKRLKGNKS
jgi:hypothetical protein